MTGDGAPRGALDWLAAWTSGGLAWDVAHGLVRILPAPSAACGQLLGLYDLRDLLDGTGRVADLPEVPGGWDAGGWEADDVLDENVLDAWLRDARAPPSFEANPANALRIQGETGVALLWQGPAALAEAERRLDAVRARRAQRLAAAR